ncbi:extracellular catalytic domain type 1 short-chain-length polyhydroxyalkanoate depolymerase [Paenibacillus kobensis]|uniref:extracellular catalytic domain type 1 short-chain-length polyhydroxyalkanoate depolymerase n=1 Tax=Paenibacillus kobensis TaxID=59841 RepID=UPI001FEA468C|nr:PHB depolymerase family esterase [Paenibacillus kobensis]
MLLKSRMISLFCALLLLTCLVIPPSQSQTASASPAGVTPGTLSRITTFGNNPGGLNMYVYEPRNLAANPALLVAVHYCSGSASAMYSGYARDYVTAAEQYGYVIIFPESTHSQYSNCFDVWSPQALSRGGGSDPVSILSMVSWAKTNYNINSSRVYAIGASSGAMMTNVLLAEYPDVFAAGTAFMGVPATCFATGSATSFWNSQCSGGQISKTAQQWGDAARAMYPSYTGSYPRMQVWHGTADTTLSYNNFAEEIKQWTNLHGVSATPTLTDSPQSTWTRTRYGNSTAQPPVEAISVQGVGHSIPQTGMIAYSIAFLGLNSGGGTTTAPAAPTSLTASAGNASVSLSWAASSGATSYTVKRAATSAGPYTNVATGVTATSYTNTGLTNGTTYYYVVSASNSAGESANSSQASATPTSGTQVQVPAAPAGLTATAGNAQVALSWTASTGAASYTVKRSTTSGGPYTNVATGVTTTSYTNTALTNGTTYYYVVSAANSAGESSNSTQASAVPTSGGGSTGTGTLVAQYKLNNANATDNQIYATFNIKNAGSSAVNLSGLKLRYYFTKDSSANLNFYADYAQIGTANVSGAFASASGTNAETYLELSFSAGAGSIAAGGQTGDIQVRISKSDWSNFNENNDYSFDGTKTVFADWNKVTLYSSGTLVWGTTP